MKKLEVENFSSEDFKNLISEEVKNAVSILTPKQQTESDGKYGTREQVAKTLHISLPNLSEKTKKGILKGHRFGSRVLYIWSEVYESVENIKNSKYKRK